MLELRSASSSAFVYAFSADVDTTGIGQVFYRETAESGLLQVASTTVDDVFPDLAPVNLTSLFIATWFYVGYFENNVDRVTHSYTLAYCTHLVFSRLQAWEATAIGILHIGMHE